MKPTPPPEHVPQPARPRPAPQDATWTHASFGPGRAAGEPRGASAVDTPSTDLDPAETVHEGRLGRFVVLRLLGMGGMGVVYSAYDELLARRVALKLVRTDRHGGDAHIRVLREAQALARLSHPNVVQIYEVSASAGRVFIAMEYVEGPTLREWIADRRPTDLAALRDGERRELLDM